MKNTFKTLLNTSAIASIFLPVMASAGVALIVNPANKNELNEDQIVKIYLGKVRDFPDGKRAKPIDQEGGQAPRVEFFEKVLHQSEASVKYNWSKIVFSGNGAPPDSVGNDEAVKKFVGSNAEAIGYIDTKSVDSSVKVIFTSK